MTTPTQTTADFIEKGANLEHERWAGWQKYLHSLCTKNEDGTLTIPKERVERWERQIATPYAELSEQEKEYDRIEVRKYLPLIEEEKERAVKETTKYPLFMTTKDGSINLTETVAQAKREAREELIDKAWEYCVKASREEMGSKEEFIKYLSTEFEVKPVEHSTEQYCYCIDCIEERERTKALIKALIKDQPWTTH